MEDFDSLFNRLPRPRFVKGKLVVEEGDFFLRRYTDYVYYSVKGEDMYFHVFKKKRDYYKVGLVEQCSFGIEELKNDRKGWRVIKGEELALII